MTVTYTVQLRYLPSNFFGRGKVRPDGTRSFTFGTIDYLSEVSHFPSYDDAVQSVKYTYPYISMDYLMITPVSSDDVSNDEVVYEIWVKLFRYSGLPLTYVVSDDNSLIPLLAKGTNFPLQFNSIDEANVYVTNLGITNATVTPVTVEF